MSVGSVRGPWWRRRVRGTRGAARIDVLEPRRLLAGDVIISEFMAINGSTIVDEDGEFSDWIELHNTTLSPINLDGWHLTDNAANLDKWTFPAVTIEPADGYLLVFASNKDRAIAGQQLHTDFQLDGDGEYLGLIRPDGLTAEYEFAPEYPQQESDVSYGTGPARSDVTSLVPSRRERQSHGARCRRPAPAGSALTSTTRAGRAGRRAWASSPTSGRRRPCRRKSSRTIRSPGPTTHPPISSPRRARRCSRLQVRGNLAFAGDSDFYSLGRLEPGDVLTLTQSASSSGKRHAGGLVRRALPRRRAGRRGPVQRRRRHGPGLPDPPPRGHRGRHLLSCGRGAFNDGGAGTYEVSAWLENGGGTPAPATSGAVPVESEPNDTRPAPPTTFRRRGGGAVPLVDDRRHRPRHGRVDYFGYQFTAGDLVTVLVDSTSGVDAAATWYSAANVPLAIDGGDSDLGSPDADDARLYAWSRPGHGAVLPGGGRRRRARPASYRADVQLSSATRPAGRVEFRRPGPDRRRGRRCWA